MDVIQRKRVIDMADKDDLLDLETEETPGASPADDKTPVEELDKGVSKDVKTSEKSSEEQEWETLSGNTQERIRQLIRERNDARDAVAKGAAQQFDLQPKAEEEKTPEFEEAVKKLSAHGLVTRQELEERIRSVQDQMILKQTHEGLEEELDGSDGRPKYVKEEIEDHMRKTGIWNPKAAYRDLYFDELQDFAIKQVKPKAKTYSEKPTASVTGRESPLTVESLRERMQRPDGLKWYEKNKEKIKPLLADLTSGGSIL